MRKYQPPTKEFFRLFNKIFTIPMTPIEFRLYAYLVCCAGSKGYCWPTMETIIRETGIKKSSLQNAIKVLQQRQLIEVRKHRNYRGPANNEYHLLSLDNPEIYRDLEAEADELPLFIGEDLPA